MKIKNIKKFIRSIIVILFVIVGLSLLISKASYSHGEKEYKKTIVSSGDTLWNIAVKESKINEYYKNKDIRYIVYDIERENKITSKTLYINQEILIPTM